jgi:hypothetical protein
MMFIILLIRRVLKTAWELSDGKFKSSLRLSIRFPRVISTFMTKKKEELYLAFLPISFYDLKKNDGFSFNLRGVSYPPRLFVCEIHAKHRA